MLQAADDAFGQFGNIFVMLVNFITDERGDNFIIRLARVKQAEAADWFSFQNYIAARDVMLGQNENIQRVAVAFYNGFT